MTDTVTILAVFAVVFPVVLLINLLLLIITHKEENYP